MLDIIREIQLFKSIKNDFVRDVKNAKIRGFTDVLPWLKTKVPSDVLEPDMEYGFSSVEEELVYATKLATMLYNPFRYVHDCENWKDTGNREMEVYFGDEVMSRYQRDNLLIVAVSMLDESDSLERKLKSHLKRSLQAEENIGYMMLLRTQPEN